MVIHGYEYCILSAWKDAIFLKSCSNRISYAKLIAFRMWRKLLDNLNFENFKNIARDF